MSSLARHLRQHEERPCSRLAFRRDCPTCRVERVAGPLPEPVLVPVKARVTIALGAILAGAAMPSGVASADRGGTSGQAIAVEGPPPPASPQHVSPSPHALAAAAAPASSNRDEAPIQVHDTAPRMAERAARPADTPRHHAEPAPLPKAGEPTPAPPRSTGEPTVVAEQRTKTTPPRNTESARGPGAHASQRSSERSGDRRGADPAPVGVRESRPADASRARPEADRSTRGPSPRPEAARAPATAHTPADGGTHVVQSGECLWQIAAGRLGERPSDAEIAEEVTRLWKLNANRIGTGNPDLIYPGQTLRI